MPVVILPSDKRFKNSPQEGDPDCFCSRCNDLIPEDDFALRAWPEDGRYEYRFCETCQSFMGITRFDDSEPDQVR